MSLRVGIIGVGTIGIAHATAIYNGEINGMELCALCDIDEERAKRLKEQFCGIPLFSSSEELIKSGDVDAVIISTPHYFHMPIAQMALENGINVLCEKPIGVYTFGMDKLMQAHKQSGKVFSVMLNQRTNKLFREAKRILDSGEIGKIKRSVWIITNWYRTQSYYNSSSWRATWQGEGGGVLMNQAPHNLDLWQWLCGMPKSIYAICNNGKYHNIEVEDEATVYAEYESGASGVFITTTGDFSGTNRLEITGTKGTIVLEKGTLALKKFSSDENDFCFGKCDKIEVEQSIIYDEEYNGHKSILQNFANAILKGEELIAPAEDAINELLICNASYLSSWTGERVEIPFDESKYLEILQKKVENSTAKEQSLTKNLFEKTYLKRWNTNW